MLEFLNGDRWRGWVPIPIRMVLGVGFIVHGWAKWNRGPAAFAELLKQARVTLPLANAWLVTLLEIFGGLALLIGAFVALVVTIGGQQAASFSYSIPARGAQRLASFQNRSA